MPLNGVNGSYGRICATEWPLAIGLMETMRTVSGHLRPREHRPLRDAVTFTTLANRLWTRDGCPSVLDSAPKRTVSDLCPMTESIDVNGKRLTIHSLTAATCGRLIHRLQRQSLDVALATRNERLSDVSWNWTRKCATARVVATGW
jgi:hypothetical protein